MKAEDLEKLLEKEGVRFVTENGIPIILVPADTYEEEAKTWTARIKGMGYEQSFGIRALYDKTQGKGDAG